MTRLSLPLKPLLCSVFILSYFFYFTHAGLTAFFTGDDGMNLLDLHGYRTRPVTSLVENALLVATPEFRPVCGLFYRAIYPLGGFNPLPLHIACFALLGANLFLVYRLIATLTSSTEIGVTAALLFSYHPRLTNMYYNSGTIYDLLCFTFYCGALLLYVSIRATGRGFTAREFPLLLVLYSGALGSKEMAITLPVILLAWELTQAPPRSWRTLRDYWPIGVLGTLTVAYVVLKLMVPNPVGSNVNYQPLLSFRSLVAGYSHYHDLLFALQERHFNGYSLGVLLVAMAGLAAALRDRRLWFGLCFALPALAPVAVIPSRAGFVLYLPMAGWATYFAVVWVRIRTSLKLRPELSLVLLAAVLFPWASRPQLAADVATLANQEKAQRSIEAIDRLVPRLPPSASLLFLDDPFGTDDPTLVLLLHLRYGDRILVDRVKVLSLQGLNANPSDYDYSFTFDHETFAVTHHALPAKSVVQFAIVPSQVKRGDSFSVSVPDLSGETISVGFQWIAEHVAKRGVLQSWCTLDAGAKCVLTVPTDQAFGKIVLTHVRSQSGPWQAARGSLAIAP